MADPRVMRSVSVKGDSCPGSIKMTHPAGIQFNGFWVVGWKKTSKFGTGFQEKPQVETVCIKGI